MHKSKDKLHLAVGAPAVLCFITFITNFFRAIKDGNIDATEMHGLLASIDGFESVVLFAVMYVMKKKDK